MKKNDTAPVYPRVPSALGWRLRPHCPSPAQISFLCPTGAAPLLLVVQARNQESSCHVSSTLLFNPQCILLALPSKGALRPSSLPCTHPERSRPVQQDNDNPFLFSPTSHPFSKVLLTPPQSPAICYNTSLPSSVISLSLCPNHPRPLAIAQTLLAPPQGLCPFCFLCLGIFLQISLSLSSRFGRLITWVNHSNTPI